MRKKIARAFSDKALPIQIKPHQVLLPQGRGAFYIVKAIIYVAPKQGVPCFIQPADGSVTRLKPFAKRLLAQGAMTFAAKFIGYMP